MLKALAVALIALLPSVSSAAVPEFSDFYMNFDRLSAYIMWRPFTEKFPFVYQKMGYKVSETGTTYFHDEKGKPEFELRLVTHLSSDRTARHVAFAIVKPDGTIVVKMIFNTFGKGLSIPPLDDLRMGKLPFVPDGKKELRTDFKLLGENGLQFKMILSRSTGKDRIERMRATFFYDYFGLTPFLQYEENTSGTRRDFKYIYTYSGYTLGVQKEQLDGMLLGNEVPTINGEPVDPGTFQKSFNSAVIGYFFFFGSQFGSIADLDFLKKSDHAH